MQQVSHTYEPTVTIAASTIPSGLQAKQNLIMGRGGRHGFALLAKMVLAISRGRKRESVYFENVAPGKLAMLLGKATHPRIHEQYKLDLVRIKGGKLDCLGGWDRSWRS